MHEAAHAVVAMFLGMKARATLERGRPGCGACEIDVPPGTDGTQRLLAALVAGSEGEGRLLHRVRTWHPSTDDAKAIARLIGGLEGPGATQRLAAAKRDAARIVRDRRAWGAIESIAAELTRRGEVDDTTVRAALAEAGLAPVGQISRAAGSSTPRSPASRPRK